MTKLIFFFFSEEKVAFFARFSNSYITMTSNNQILVFDHVLLNEGNGYRRHTGIFTCPLAGIYNIQWTILPNHRATFHTELVVNGDVIMFNYAASQVISRTTSTMATMYLSLGDKVWIRKHGNNRTTINGGFRSAFQAFKL